MAPALHWADVLDKDLGHVVLVKENRLQVIVRPTRKQLLRRGRRGWVLVVAIEAEPEANGAATVPPAVGDVVLEALAALGRGDLPRSGRSKKAGKKADKTSTSDKPREKRKKGSSP